MIVDHITLYEYSHSIAQITKYFEDHDYFVFPNEDDNEFSFRSKGNMPNFTIKIERK